MPTEEQAREEERPRRKKTKVRVDEETVKALRKVTDLVRLAHANENEEEARNAALTAVNLMHEHSLCVIPASEVERLRKMISDMQRSREVSGGERMKQMGIGFVAGMLLSKGKLF